jgi:ArsR family metal-binding transcriptional regulator
MAVLMISSRETSARIMDEGNRVKPKNAFEIFHFLDKSNCKQCGEKTCLAFAGAVSWGKKA